MPSDAKLGPYIQLRGTSHISAHNKHFCKSYINVDGWNARIEEKYATEAMRLPSGRAAISYGWIMQTAGRGTEFSGDWIYTLLIINYDVSEGIGVEKCVGF